MLDCVTQNVHSPQHTYMSSSYRSDRLGLAHWDLYAVRRGGCLELYYCNMLEWFWCDSSLVSTTNWFSSVLWHCWLGHLACKNRPRNDLLCVEWDVKHYTLTLASCAVDWEWLSSDRLICYLWSVSIHVVNVLCILSEFVAACHCRHATVTSLTDADMVHVLIDQSDHALLHHVISVKFSLLLFRSKNSVKLGEWLSTWFFCMG